MHRHLITCVLLCVVTSGCTSRPDHLWSKSPIPAELVEPLTRIDIAMAGSDAGRSSAIAAGDGSYYLIAHGLPKDPLNTSININWGKARITEHVACRVSAQFVDGWAKAEIVEGQTTQSTANIPWQPDRHLHVGEAIYAVTTHQAANPALQNASPLHFPDHVIVPGKVAADSRGMLIVMTVPKGIPLLGLSGGACAVWDDQMRSLVLVGLYSATTWDGQGIVIRPLHAEQIPADNLVPSPPSADQQLRNELGLP